VMHRNVDLKDITVGDSNIEINFREIECENEDWKRLVRCIIQICRGFQAKLNCYNREFNFLDRRALLNYFECIQGSLGTNVIIFQ
jgi:hypothetical protein